MARSVEKMGHEHPFIYMGFDTFHVSAKQIVIWTNIIQIPVLFFAHSF